VDSNGDGHITTDDTPSQNAIGFAVDDLDLAVVLYSDEAKKVPDLWALSATVDFVGLVGIDFLKIQGEQVRIAANQGDNWEDTEVSPFVDFQSTFGAGGLSVLTGGAPMSLDFDSPLFGVYIGMATLQISEFVFVQGSFAYEQGARRKVTIDTGTSFGDLQFAGTALQLEAAALYSDVELSDDWRSISNVEVETTLMGIKDANVFVGYGIPDWDSDVLIRDQEGVFGRVMADIDVALAIMKPTGELGDIIPEFTSLKASASEFVVAGGGDIFQLYGQDIEVRMNWSSSGRPTMAICWPVARIAVNLVPWGTKMDLGLLRFGACVVRMVIPKFRSLTTIPMASSLISSAK
jgi:hypothetical protein